MNNKLRLDYNYHDVPDHTAEALENYFFHGYEPGSFVYAVLTNDLIGACTRCDHINRENIVNIVKWLLQRAPAGSWGSDHRVLNWVKDTDQCRTRFVEEWEKRTMWETLSSN